MAGFPFPAIGALLASLNRNSSGKESMVCYTPLSAWKSLIKQTSEGKCILSFDTSRLVDPNWEAVQLPCGQCIGCRITRSKEWALRCVHEASLWHENAFITLTFNDDHLNKDGSLVKSDFVNFMKRFRKKTKGMDAAAKDGKVIYPIRFFHCGEYGDDMKRPHHHACIFNYDFPDKKHWMTRKGHKVYRSALLEKLWSDDEGKSIGFSEIGEVNFESAAYVARYITKKINGPHAASHYYRHDEDGVAFYLEPEYITMSRRPGLAADWFEKFKDDVYPKDYVTHKGTKHRPPKYYDRIYDILEPERMAQIKLLRKEAQKGDEENQTLERLKVRAACARANNKRLTREYENADPKNVLDL